MNTVALPFPRVACQRPSWTLPCLAPSLPLFFCQQMPSLFSPALSLVWKRSWGFRQKCFARKRFRREKVAIFIFIEKSVLLFSQVIFNSNGYNGLLWKRPTEKCPLKGTLHQSWVGLCLNRERGGGVYRLLSKPTSLYILTLRSAYHQNSSGAINILEGFSFNIM